MSEGLRVGIQPESDYKSRHTQRDMHFIFSSRSRPGGGAERLQKRHKVGAGLVIHRVFGRFGHPPIHGQFAASLQHFVHRILRRRAVHECIHLEIFLLHALLGKWQRDRFWVVERVTRVGEEGGHAGVLS